MRKHSLLPLALLSLALPLSACSGDDAEPEKPETASVVLEEGAVTQTVSPGVSYGKLEFQASEPVDTLWLKPAEKQEGTLKIEVCTTEWEDGKCADAQLSLAPVDLSGWEYDLATAGTQMSPEQTRYFKFTTEAEEPVELRWSVKQEAKPEPVAE